MTRGAEWGSFLDVRTNAAESYAANVDRERRFAHERGRPFTIFLSSSTDPFVPQEQRYHITRSVLETMLDSPPDTLILQTHSHRLVDYLELYRALAQVCNVRIHLSIETDRDRIPGLPNHASSVDGRFKAAAQLKQAGLNVVITVSPLLPIADPEQFFARVAECANAVVLDHFIGGDGSSDGSRTRRTELVPAMAALEPTSVELSYRDEMAEIALRHLPGRVGVHTAGFAGRFEKGISAFDS